MFSDDVDNIGFIDKDAVVLEEDSSTDIIRIVFKCYEEDRSRLEYCNRDKKQGEQQRYVGLILAISPGS